MKISLRHVALFGLVASLAACSGGGGGETQPPDPNNIAPVVSAGSDRTVNSGAQIQLAATASDPDGSIVGVQWVQTSGLTVVLQGANTLTPSFAAPAVNQGQETLEFTVTVTDNGNATASDTVRITLTAPVSGAAPVIQQPIPEVRANAEESVTLTATATDDDGEITAYKWSFTGSDPEVTPALSITFKNNNDADPITTFDAPVVDVPTRLFFSLEVEDNGDPVNTDTATTSVLVYPLPKPAEAARLYVSDGGALIARFNSSASTPTEFVTDTAFGRFNPGASARTIDGPFVLTVDGRLVQTDDEDANSIQEVCAFGRRVGNGQYASNRDRMYRYYVDKFPDDANDNTDAYIENYAGVAIDHKNGYVIAIDTYSGGGSADARAVHVYGASVQGNRRLVADIPLGGNGRDLLYDDVADRLFVTLDNARVAVFNDFIADVEAARAAVGNDSDPAGGNIPVDALIAVTGFQAPAEHDFRGLAYHRASDRLIISDVGYVTSAEHPEGVSDGKIIILSNATAAARSGFGALVDADAVISGLAGTAQLGDPTDIALNGRDLIVADQANGRVYVYDDVFGGFGARSPAPADGPLVIAGARYLAVQPLDVPARPHVNDLGPETDATVTGFMALRTIDVGGSPTAELIRILPDLASNTGMTLPRLQFGLGNTTLGALGISLNGDLYAHTGIPFSGTLGVPVLDPFSGGKTSVRVINSGALNRLTVTGASESALRDRTIVASGAVKASAVQVIDEFGVVVAADRGGRTAFSDSNDGTLAPGIAIYSTCGAGTQLGARILTADNANPPNPKTPTGIDYDGSRGDLYLSFSDGTIGIFRDFNNYLESLIANPDTPNTPAPLLVVTPMDPTAVGGRAKAAGDYQDIEYLPTLDQIALSSQGSVSDNADGQLFLIGRRTGFAASEIFTQDVDIDVKVSGAATGLGNPVDLAFDGFNLYVAEKGNGAILRFDNVETMAGGNMAPSSAFPLSGVETIVPLPDYLSGNPEERSE